MASAFDNIVIRDWASTIFGTKTYAKRQLPKRVLPVPQEREEGGVPPSGSNR